MWPFAISENEKRRRARERKRKQWLKSRAALHKELDKETQYYGQLIPDILAQTGQDHWLPKERRPSVLEEWMTGRQAHQKIRIIEARGNEAALYLRIDPTRLPYGTTIAQLKDPDLLETLSIACQRQTIFKVSPQSGAWYVVLRDGSIAAIPAHFSFRDAFENIPQSAGPLVFTSGVGENMTLIQPDLADLPHLLVAGATGSGKSNFLHSLLTTFVLRVSPANLQIMLVDLKNGMELGYYHSLPHVKRLVTDPLDVPAALIEFKEEMGRRQAQFAGHCRDILGWNKLYRDRQMPYYLLVIDELAQVLKHPDSHLAKQVEDILGSILAVSRATGGHAIICTQRPSSDVITGYLKVNIPTRVALAVPSKYDSRTIIDSGDAANLEPVGRGVILLGPRRILLQTPFISEGLVRRAVARIVGNQTTPRIAAPSVTMQDMATYGVQNLGGALNYRALEKAFKAKTSLNKIREAFREMEGRTFIVDGITYQVVTFPGTAGRRLVPLGDDTAGNGGNGDKRPADTEQVPTGEMER